MNEGLIPWHIQQSKAKAGAHFCTCARAAFHWPSEETLTAAATILVLEAAYIVARPLLYARLRCPQSLWWSRSKAGKKAALQLSHFLGILLNKT